MGADEADAAVVDIGPGFYPGIGLERHADPTPRCGVTRSSSRSRDAGGQEIFVRVAVKDVKLRARER